MCARVCDFPLYQMQRSLSLPPLALAAGVLYAIGWEPAHEQLLPVAMHGSHSFLQRSKLFFAERGHSGLSVDRSGGVAYRVLQVATADPRFFARKQAAIVCGIVSILFVRRDDGSVLEIGFGRELGNEEVPSLLLAGGLSFFAPWEKSPQCLRGLGSEHSDAKSSFSSSECSTQASSTSEPWPSRGSEGHPDRCKLACKFFYRRRGCKDGMQCDRCHLCPFTRCAQRLGRGSQDASADSFEDQSKSVVTGIEATLAENSPPQRTAGRPPRRKRGQVPNSASVPLAAPPSTVQGPFAPPYHASTGAKLDRPAGLVPISLALALDCSD